MGDCQVRRYLGHYPGGEQAQREALEALQATNGYTAGYSPPVYGVETVLRPMVANKRVREQAERFVVE